MNILMISGSRNRQGKTATMAEALLRGAEGAKAKCERIFLPELAIERCRQCDEHGWGGCSAQGQCVIEDDFAAVAAKVRAADAVVFANPVYFGDLSESLRAFLDRLRRTACYGPVKEALKGKPVVGVCVAGGSGGGAALSTVSMGAVLGFCGFDVQDLVPVRRQNMSLKAQTLEITGRWMAEPKEA